MATLFKGEIWHLKDDPFTVPGAFEIIERGALVADDAGRISALGPARELVRKFPRAKVIDCGRNLILPGFVDAHLHLPQLDMIGAPGGDLLH